MRHLVLKAMDREGLGVRVIVKVRFTGARVTHTHAYDLD